MMRPSFVPSTRGDTSETVIAIYEASGSGNTIATLKLGDNKYYGKFQNIIVSSFSESYEEISKIQTNFSESWNIFMFGASPRIVELSGYFIDSQYSPYYQEFMTAYDKYLSGSKCVDNNMETVLFIDGRAIQAVILGVSIRYTGLDENLKGFGMRLVVKRDIWLRQNYGENGEVTNSANYLYNSHATNYAEAQVETVVENGNNVEESVED